MTANTSPIFVLTPNIGMASVAAANTSSDGSGTLVTLFTAGANGSRLERIRYSNAQATAAASSAMVIRVFLTDAAGTNPKLIDEVAVLAATRTVAVVGTKGILTYANGLIIPTGSLVKVIQSVYAGAQDLMHYVAEGGDF